MAQYEIRLEKPAIKVFFSQDIAESHFREILYGMEEEGVPYELTAAASQDATRLAYDAAQSSRLGVGVGVSGYHAALHFEKLAPDAPLFAVAIRDIAKCRNLGANAARLVKHLPFKAM